MSTTIKTAFITGASTGIGRDCALALDRKGYRVFAGVRRAQDGESLQRDASPRLSPVICDVSDYASVARAEESIREQLGAGGLDGLVNNAGVSVSGPLELLRMEQFEHQMRVNVQGQLAVTQAFLPLLRRNRGRVVFISSESGRATLPLLGAYSASKFALEALANAFRMELSRFGIRVALIEPGSVKSEIWTKAIETGFDALRDEPALRALYATDLPLLTAIPKLAEKAAVQPAAVTRAIEHALSSRFPKARYIVGAEARALILFAALTPTVISDMLVRTTLGLIANRVSAREAKRLSGPSTI